jgi:hypothetical protein
MTSNSNVLDFSYVSRSCSACGSQNLESLWAYDFITNTISKQWRFKVNNVICKECGFVFVSPSPNGESLLSYYGDSYSKFDGQSIDYDIEKRLNLINQYCPQKETFIEIGANTKTDFHTKLHQFFKEVITIEPNQSSESEYNSLSEIKGLQADCLTHYFVLEHIPDLTEFFNGCERLLKDNGVMICEIPSLSLYENFISPLILFEHVNHFTPHSLANVAIQHGFELIHFSHEECSRPYGFVAIFKKSKGKLEYHDSEYEKNRYFFNVGFAKVKVFLEGLDSARALIDELKTTKQSVIVWAVNDTTKRMFEDRQIPDNVVLVDSDPRKKNYLDQRSASLPNEVSLLIQNAGHIIICTKIHSMAILDYIQKTFSKSFNDEHIRVVDIL